MVFSDRVCRRVTGRSYPGFRQAPISFSREISIIVSTKGHRAMMTRIQKTACNRIHCDPRINLMGERVDRVWADPILTLRRDLVR
jgi:hypothetical protein